MTFTDSKLTGSVCSCEKHANVTSQNLVTNLHTFIPKVNIYEEGYKYVLDLELPGLMKEDLKIVLEDNILNVQGERKKENDSKLIKQIRSERKFGTFNRKFKLPENINRLSIEAYLIDGILNIELKKHKIENDREREININ